jgi:hypothetical protein
MKNFVPKIPWQIAIVLLGGAGFLLAFGCSCNHETSSASASDQTPQTQPDEFAAGQPAPGQPLFATDTDLADALVSAAKAQDHPQVHQLLGPDWKSLVSGDPHQDAESFQEFAQRASESMRLERQGDSTTIVHIGNDDWAFPIPLVKTPDGKWFLDTETGKQEVWARRVGKDELIAIGMCRALVIAQKIYGQEHPGADGQPIYAEHVQSQPGQTDGLFSPNDPSSPLIQAVAQTKLQDYQPEPGRHEPYHGYHFHVLKNQGPDASGGALTYLQHGQLVQGFAFVAFPDIYEWTGVMTFIVNQDGKVYQKDLGPDTTKIARKMTTFNPDSSWTLVNN